MSSPWIILAVSLGTAAMAFAQPQYFRQEGGVHPAAGPLPATFDSATQHWRQPLDPGHSSPIIRGDQIFLTTFRPDNRELATVALDLETGQEKWRRVAPADRLEPYHRVGSPAAATPACDGERLYVFFGSYGLLCYRLDGTELWRYPMGPFQDEFGAGSSPILVDGKVIISQDHDVDSFVMAIDARTGEKVWRTSRPEAVRSYSSPTIWTHAGRTEILVPGALQLTSYDADTGSQRWWISGLARIVIPLAVAHEETIFMASWSPGGDAGARVSLGSWAEAVRKWDKNQDDRLTEREVTDQEVLSRFYRMDLDQNQQLTEAEWDRHAVVFQRAQNAVLAIRPTGSGELSEDAIQWKYPRGAPYVATPLLHNGVLWIVKDGGIVTKLEAATGELLHQERLPGLGNYYASPVCADNKVYFASEQGVASVAAAQREWRIISSHDFKEKIYATPAVLGSQMIIRTEQALYCFRGR